MRRFIRIDELSDYVTVSKGEVLDAIENKKMAYCVPVDWKNMGAVVVKEGKRYVHAVFDYSGMIFLTYDISRELAIHDHDVNTEIIGVVEPNKVMNWRSVPCVFKNVKSGELPFVNEPEPIPTGYFQAYASVEAGITSKQVRDSFLQLITMMAERSTTMPKSDTGLYLKSKAVTISPDIVRIDLKQVASMFPNSVVGQRTKPNNTLHQPLFIETHPIKQIIERVVHKEPQMKSGQIWTLLRQDVQSDGKREFDCDSLIFDMSADDLHYFGQGDVTNKLARRRFQNLVSEVKRKVHG